jgi:lysozyme
MNVIDQLIREEGEVLHAYEDHLGYLTIGVGILIDKRKGGGITKEESRFLLLNRVKGVVEGIRKHLSWFDSIGNEPRKAVLIGMAFQMGLNGLLGFKNTLEMIRVGDYDKAAVGMLNSLWARQTPARAKRMAKQMETGEWVS